MIVHLVARLESDGALDIDGFKTGSEASAFIAEKARETYDEYLLRHRETEVDLLVHPYYARVSVTAAGRECDTVFEYRMLKIEEE